MVVVIALKAGGRLSDAAQVDAVFGSPAEIGRLFLGPHLLAFEATSIVLLVAAVGGVILRSAVPKESRVSAPPAMSARLWRLQGVAMLRPRSPVLRFSTRAPASLPTLLFARQCRGNINGRSTSGRPGVAAYLVISVLLFATGALGVLIRRSPLIILLALEIMLNAGNLALIAFSRHAGNGDGQIFALTVMVVAAAEAVVGLGLVRRLPAARRARRRQAHVPARLS